MMRAIICHLDFVFLIKMQYNSFTIIIALLIHNSGFTKSNGTHTYGFGLLLIVQAKSPCVHCVVAVLAAGDEIVRH